MLCQMVRSRPLGSVPAQEVVFVIETPRRRCSTKRAATGGGSLGS